MKKEKSSRPKLPVVSEQMKAWSAALEAEVGSWPHASTRSFFGFTALYRKDKIFAALPRTRGWDTANSIAFKLESPSSAMLARLDQDSRTASSLGKNGRWFTFELSTDSDLHDAIDWLGRAYEAAARKKKTS
jgi:hypothetical protein